ncbi:MAG: LamG domain-containing protein [Thermofilaceae archaeon]
MSAGRVLRAGGLYYDGIDDYVGVPGFSAPFPKTVAFYMYPLPKTGFQYVVGKSYGGAGEFVIQFELSFPQTLRLYGWDGTSTFWIGTSSTSFHANRWYHVAVILANPTTYIYVDGALDREISLTRTLTEHPTSRLRLGARYPDNASPFWGIIDDVRIYNRALTADEIRAIYERDALIRDGLVLHLDFSEYEGDIAYDKSGCGNHATIYGARWVVKKALYRA